MDQDGDVDMMEVDAPVEEQEQHSNLKAKQDHHMYNTQELDLYSGHNTHEQHQQHQSRTHEQHRKQSPRNESGKSPKSPQLLVLDTNFLISHLDIIEELRQLGPQYQHQIIIPYVVIQELDNLKEKNRDRDVSTLARQATNWIQSQLSVHDHYVKGQQLSQIEQRNLRGDDSILDCCLHFQKNYNALTIILTNDKNLCVKALVHGIRTVSFASGTTTAKKIAEIVRDEANGIAAAAASGNGTVMEEAEVNIQEDRHNRMSLETRIERFEKAILETLVAHVDWHMRKVYDQAELNYFGYNKHMLKNTRDIAEFISKYSIAVFGEFVPKAVLERAKNVKPPTSESSMAEYVDTWGSVLIHLAPDIEVKKIKEALAPWR